MGLAKNALPRARNQAKIAGLRRDRQPLTGYNLGTFAMLSLSFLIAGAFGPAPGLASFLSET